MPSLLLTLLLWLLLTLLLLLLLLLLLQSVPSVAAGGSAATSTAAVDVAAGGCLAAAAAIIASNTALPLKILRLRALVSTPIACALPKYLHHCCTWLHSGQNAYKQTSDKQSLHTYIADYIAYKMNDVFKSCTRSATDLENAFEYQAALQGKPHVLQPCGCA